VAREARFLIPGSKWRFERHESQGRAEVRAPSLAHIEVELDHVAVLAATLLDILAKI
jgi:hypothetical protein